MSVNKYRVVDIETGEIIPIDSKSLHDLHLKLMEIDPVNKEHLQELIKTFMIHCSTVIESFMLSHDYDCKLTKCEFNIEDYTIKFNINKELVEPETKDLYNLNNVTSDYYDRNRNVLTKTVDRKDKKKENNSNKNKVLHLSDRITFGKYKGKLIRNIPKDYREWLETAGYSIK